jgi:hypothetical protein
MPNRRANMNLSHEERSACNRAGFTLVELLVASTLGLMTMAALATLFATFGRTVSQSQALVDLSGRMRNAAWRLRQDLQGMTTPAKTWVRAEASAGYFQIVEGGTTTTTALIGDCDDTLALTTLALGNPFTGRLDANTNFESPYAEVVWFCERSTQQFEGQTLFTLYRRQLLVSATPGAGSFTNSVTASISRDVSDLSYRTGGTGQLANSLADLTKPAHRFLTMAGAARTLQGDRQGEDVILSNVVAFDVRRYSVNSGTATLLDQSFNTDYADGGTPSGTTAPPGIEIRIRCIEPSSRQVRQFTVVHAFEAQ